MILVNLRPWRWEPSPDFMHRKDKDNMAELSMALGLGQGTKGLVE
jgi:hypothetical protein